MIVACFCGEVLEGDIVTFCHKCLEPVPLPLQRDTLTKEITDSVDPDTPGGPGD